MYGVNVGSPTQMWGVSIFPALAKWFENNKWIKIMTKWTNLTKEEIKNLPIEEFHALALKQKEIFPDLLKICDENTILETFYRAYERKFDR